MEQTLNFRDVYTAAYNSKNPSRDMLTKRYLDVINRTDRIYDSIQKDIDREYNGYFNAASAQNAIAKSNTAEDLAQKGLSKSGQSVQSSILHDMSLANTMAQLENQKAEKSAQNNQNRVNHLSSLEKELIDAQAQYDSEERKLEYQKERDEVKDKQWKDEFDYNASRANVSDYKWEKEQERQEKRDAESDRQWNVSHAYEREQNAVENDRKERELAREIYENDRDYQLSRDKFEAQNALDKQELEIKKTTAQTENSIKSQYLALEREAQQKKYAQSSSDGSTDKNAFGTDYTVDKDGYYTPNMSANSLLNIIEYNAEYGTWSKTEGYVSPKKLAKKRLLQVIGDPDLSDKYREELLFLAAARGLLE